MRCKIFAKFRAGVSFAAVSSDAMLQASELHIVTKQLYQDIPGSYRPMPYGPLDNHLVSLFILV